MTAHDAASGPAWKRNGRKGPFDWWIGCALHTDAFVDSCMSCGIAQKHNEELRARIERESK